MIDVTGEEMGVGNSEVKKRIKYNSQTSDLSNWMNCDVICEMGKTEEEAETMSSLYTKF